MQCAHDESDADYIECPACGGYSAAHGIEGDALCEHCSVRLPYPEID